MNSLLITFLVILVLSCGNEANDCQTALSCGDTTFNVEQDAIAEENSEEESEEESLVPEPWSLLIMKNERYWCEDDFYDLVNDPNMFCQCLIEKLSMRWEFVDYKRHSYTYLSRLSKNGTLDRCNKPPSFWEEETEEEIKEDQMFIPDENKDIEFTDENTKALIADD